MDKTHANKNGAVDTKYTELGIASTYTVLWEKLGWILDFAKQR